MAESKQSPIVVMASPRKRHSGGDGEEDRADGGEKFAVAKKRSGGAAWWSGDPVHALASARHEFGEHGGVNMSIEASATFTVMEPDTMRRMFAGELGPDRDFFIYSRHFNPTVLNLGRQMAALEGTEAAYCTASGMSAISSVLLQVCGAGGHIVASRRLYGGTHALMSHFLTRACGIQTTFVDIGDLAAVSAAIREGETKVLYLESVANPTLAVADVPSLCAVAHEKGVMVVVDNTFSPMVISPARMGADVVVHSVSKFISGGADVIAGKPHRLHSPFLRPGNLPSNICGWPGKEIPRNDKTDVLRSLRYENRSTRGDRGRFQNRKTSRGARATTMSSSLAAKKGESNLIGAYI